MKTRWLGGSLLITAFVLLGVREARTGGDSHDSRFRASLNGSNEVPAISTTARGDFRAQLTAPDTLSFRLRYSGLAGPDTLAAHIHFGQHDVNGGVSAFLCGGSTKPACPSGSGEVTGTIVPADVIGPTGQGILVGEFAELLRAIRRGDAYVNVHTTPFPNGEIRGQIKDHDDD